MEIMNSGNPIVDQVAQMHFTGNIIPKSWSNTIVYNNGKTNLVAILLLAEIVYWYRPTEERDENGKYIRFKKKFADKEFLQKSYSQISQELGITENQAKAAVITLEKDFEVIKRHFKRIEAKNGRVIPNVMFIELMPGRLRELTFGTTSDNDCDGGMKVEIGVPQFINRDIPNYNRTYPNLELGTNTKNTYIDNNRDYFYPSNQANDYKIAREEFMEQIDYDAIAIDRKTHISMLDGIVDLVVEVLISKKLTVCIVGEDVPIEIVRNKFNKLDMNDVTYVIDQLASTTTKVKNPKKYMLAALYNANSYQDFYWTNQVNHDMYGGD